MQRNMTTANSSKDVVKIYPPIESISNIIRTWFGDTTKSYTDVCNDFYGNYVGLRYYLSNSATTILEEAPVEGDIIMISQFFLPNNTSRANEIKTALQVNVSNPFIDKIILLNERVYTKEELGIDSDKVEQVVLGKRLEFKDVFDYVDNKKITGYIVLSNIDIFFDKSIEVLRRSGLSTKKKMFTLLRHEYDPTKRILEQQLFNHYFDSQDTWIWHTNSKLDKRQKSVLDFQLGTPGCDNTMIYLMQVFGFETHNEPLLIKNYHFHKTNIRNYDSNTKPTSQPFFAVHAVIDDTCKQDLRHPFTITGENYNFLKFIRNQLASNKHFIVPRLAGVELMVAVICAIAQRRGQYHEGEVAFLRQRLQTMKNNAGIELTNINNICEYSNDYLSAFSKCEGFFDWEPQGNVACGGNGFTQKTFEFVECDASKQRFWSVAVLDIFHNVYLDEPWTHALSGRRLLIVSSFADTFQKQLPHLSKIYGRDLFPGCSFVFLKPPVTNGSNRSRPYRTELNEFKKRIENIKNEFDIALVSCGGYGNPILAKIYDMGKSAIYVGGVLQMYFGVYGSRWERERPTMMRLFKNEYWVRPTAQERPVGFEKVEGSCYW